jgi:hypothetical protein
MTERACSGDVSVGGNPRHPIPTNHEEISMLRTLLSCTAILLMSVAGGALAQNYTNSPAHENEVQRGAPYIDALNLLEAQGYASFSNFREEGGGRYSADAVRDGQAMHVIIDPASGQVAAAGPAQNMPQTQTGGAR